MLSIDGTFLIILLSFVVFLALMDHTFFTPVMAVQAEREEAIGGSHRVADEALSKVGQVTVSYGCQLDEARRQAQQLISARREEAKAQAQAHLAEARQQALDRYEADAQRLSGESQHVYDVLQSRTSELAHIIVRHIRSEAQPLAAGPTH